MTGGGSRATRNRARPAAAVADGDEGVRNRKPIRRIRRERSRDLGPIRLMDVSVKTLLGLGFGCLAILLVGLLSLTSIWGSGEDEVNQMARRVVTPLDAPKMIDLPQFQGEHKESLYWGTYRPQVYLGIRARTPRSLIAGLMWLGIKNGQYFLRHVCQDSDELSKYGWTDHNGRDYGRQVLVDHDMSLTTSFLKVRQNGSGYGGDWAVRVNVQNEQQSRDEAEGRVMHLFFYIADEEGNSLSIGRSNTDSTDGSPLAFGSRKDVGKWEVHLQSEEDLEIHHSGFKTLHMHNLTELVQGALAFHAKRTGRIELPEVYEDSANVLVFQIIAKMSSAIDIAFVSGTGLRNSRIEERINSLTGTRLTGQLNKKQKDFEERYHKVFNLTDKAFDNSSGSSSSPATESIQCSTSTMSLCSPANYIRGTCIVQFHACDGLGDRNVVLSEHRIILHLSEVHGKVDSEDMIVGRAAIGNLLGGIGYFYGQSKIALPKGYALKSGEKFVSYWTAALYTAVPSRSFFPRGFLWDEGFHQLLIWRWDTSICMDIIGHWLDLINIDGWIPREQILGAEALSKVPEEFVPQHPTNGNPPTLFLALRDLANGLKESKFSTEEASDVSNFLNRARIRLGAWFQWFNTTQAGKELDTFYWHGRDNVTNNELNPKTLSSGFDDYPRASHPSAEERHLDLRCWMLLAANCMQSIEELVGIKDGLEKEYALMTKVLSNFEILNQMHLDDVSGAYFDFGNHTEKVRLRWQNVGVDHVKRELVRETLERPQLGLVPHVGYVSLFPFIMGIIPSESPVLRRQLDLISNRTILWTDYGLRSLSKTSSLYMRRNTEHDPPYWRGPIWINMNYMILSALHHYAQEDGPYRARARTIYEELRRNLIRNIVQNYYETGYLWEQYDQKNKGKGKGARPFTGWTSLVLLIMAEAYPTLH